MPLCKSDDCLKHANYDIENGKGSYCTSHKLAGMLDVKKKTCENGDCTKTPTFNTIGNKPRFCSIHKTGEMVDVVNKRCSFKDCKSISPVYNVKGKKAGMYCSTHKEPDMINVKDKKCEYEGCSKVNPTFGNAGGKGRFCLEHKLKDMINVKSKLCEFSGCDKVNPTYDKEGGTGKYCRTHKDDSMINVKSKRCQSKDCDSINPVFDIKGGKGTFCSQHKTDKMIDVKNKRCEEEGCLVISPCYDVKGGKGRFCLEHKSDKMVNIKTKFCEIKECQNSARYGRPGHSKDKCFKHREVGMILRPNCKCKYKGCKEPALWGDNWVPINCSIHKSDSQKNLVEKPCISCNLLYLLDDSNKCEMCNPISWAKARLAKQNALTNYLDSRDLTGISTDKIVDGGTCGRERPDRIYDFDDKIVILECDEHQHKERACECEQIRMINISQSFGGIPVYFIRWNPDNYVSEDHIKPEILSKRHKLCGDLISDIKTGRIAPPNSLLSVLYLYFDGWTSLQSEKWKIITSY